MASTWCCITPEREEKTRRIMRCLVAGWPGSHLCLGAPPTPDDPFIVWGQIWLAESLIKGAIPRQRRFWQIDNGFFEPARGTVNGYYRFMYSRPHPVFLRDEAIRRSRKIKVPMKPWRKTGTHILLAVPGPDFGRAFNIDCASWHLDAYKWLLAHTDRPVKVRARTASHPLAFDLNDAWAVVTHSSNVAVEAVFAGIPVFVKPTSMALPVGALFGEASLDYPRMPDREDWWASLACQQFTLQEMSNGTAFRYLSEVKKQVDLDGAYWPPYG